MATHFHDFSGDADAAAGGANSTTGTNGVLRDARGGLASVSGGKLLVTPANDDADRIAFLDNDTFKTLEGYAEIEFSAADLAGAPNSGPGLALRYQKAGGNAIVVSFLLGGANNRLLTVKAGLYHDVPWLGGYSSNVVFNLAHRYKLRAWAIGVGSSCQVHAQITNLNTDAMVFNAVAGGGGVANEPGLPGYQGVYSRNALNESVTAKIETFGGSDVSPGTPAIVLADPAYTVTDKTLTYTEITLAVATGGDGSYTYSLKYGPTMQGFDDLPNTCAPTVAGGRVFRIPKGAESYVYYSWKIVSGTRSEVSTTTVEAFATEAPEVGVAGGDSMTDSAVLTVSTVDPTALDRYLRDATGAWGEKVKFVKIGAMKTVPGSTAAQWAADDGGKLTDFITAINAQGATFCTIALGRNDASAGRTAVQFLGNIATIINAVKAGCPTITKIYLLDTMYAKPFGVTVTAATNQLCQEYGAGMAAAYASDPKVIFVDGLFEGIGRDPNRFLGDQTTPGQAEFRIHLSLDGMEFVGRQIAHYMLGSSGGGSGAGNGDGDEYMRISQPTPDDPTPVTNAAYVKLGSSGDNLALQFDGPLIIRSVAAGGAQPTPDKKGRKIGVAGAALNEKSITLDGTDLWAIAANGTVSVWITK